MESRREKIIYYVVVPIACVLLAGFVGWWIGVRQNSIQYLEYHVTRSNNIMGGIKSDFKINAMDAKAFSIVDVKVFNRTNNDYDNLKITFRLLVDSPTVLGHDVRTANMDLLTNIAVGKTNEYTFETGTANRDEDNPIVEANFIIAGTLSPDCVVILDQKGIKIKRELNPQESKDRMIFWIVGVVILSLVIGALIFFRAYLAEKYLKKREEKLFTTIPKDRDEYLKFLQAWYEAQERKLNK